MEKTKLILYHIEDQGLNYRKENIMQQVGYVMVTCCVSSKQLAALLAENEELNIYEAVNGCLRAAGLPPWPRVEAELFSGVGSALLIARPASSSAPDGWAPSPSL